MRVRYFIYILVDPFTNAVRYVGATVALRRRLANHICPCAIAGTHHRARWIASLIARGKKPTMRALESVSADVWQERERYWITYYRQRGCELTNTAEGGLGGSTYGHAGKRHSEETKKRISEAKRGRKSTLTPEQRKANGQRIWETRRRNGTTGLGRTWEVSEETRQRMCEKARERLATEAGRIQILTAAQSSADKHRGKINPEHSARMRAIHRPFQYARASNP